MRWLVVLLLLPMAAAQAGGYGYIIVDTQDVELAPGTTTEFPIDVRFECDPLSPEAAPFEMDINFTFETELNDITFEADDVTIEAQCIWPFTASPTITTQASATPGPHTQGLATRFLNLTAHAVNPPTGFTAVDGEDQQTIRNEFVGAFSSWMVRNSYTLDEGEKQVIPITVQNDGNANLRVRVSVDDLPAGVDDDRAPAVILQPSFSGNDNNWTVVEFVLENYSPGWGTGEITFVIDAAAEADSEEKLESQYFTVTLHDGGGGLLDVPSPGWLAPVALAAVALLRRR